MKQKLLFLLLSLVGLGFWTTKAQTDVTSTYLSNADFETSPTGNAADNTIYDVPGWTETPVAGYAEFYKLGTVAYGASTAGLGTVPANGSSVASDNTSLLGLKLHWSENSVINVSQKATLPAGAYTLKFDSYVAQIIANAYYQCGVTFAGKTFYAASPVAKDTWYNKEVTFILSESTEVTFTFGYTKSENKGGTESPILFIDNVKLFEVDTQTASSVNPLDLTIDNHSFENNFTGWTNSGFSIATNNPLYTKEGIRHAEKYVNPGNTLPNSDLNQTITGLPAGKYIVKASALARKNQNGSSTADIEGAILYAGTAQTLVSTAGDYEVEVTVVDGTLKLGFKIENAPEGTNWVSVDNFRLSYLGVDLTALLDALEIQVTNAETITGKMQGTVATALTNAISSAQDVLDNSSTATQADIENAAGALTAATNAANASIAAYASLTAYIDQVQAIVDDYTDGEDKTTINAAIAAAQGVYDNATADVAGVNAAKATLKDALKVFGITNTSETKPFELTDEITNPSFETGNTSGWTLTSSAGDTGVKPNSNGTYTINNADGDYVFNTYDGADKGHGISQSITGLPDGIYKMSVLIATNEGRTVKIFANLVEKTHTHSSNSQTGETESVDVIISNGKIDLGTKAGNNWYKVDNFQLFYYGEVQDPVITVSDALLFLNESMTQRTFTVSAVNLTNDITFSTGSVAGVSFNPSSIDKDDEDLATGITVTATFNPAAEGAATASGNITVSSTDAESKTIPIVTSIDSDCFTPVAGATNLVPDPLMLSDNLSAFGASWGTFSRSFENPYCGATSGKITGKRGGSITIGNFTWIPNQAYILRAAVKTDDEGFVFGLGKSYVDGVQNKELAIPNTNNTWQIFEQVFVTGASAGTDACWLNNYTANNGTVAYLDNWEIYTVSQVTFNSNGGSAVASQNVINGTKAVEPADPTLAQFSFEGWFTDNTWATEWNFDEDVVTTPITLYAKWHDETGISTLSDTIIKTEYYNLQGQKIAQPIENGVYLMKNIYASDKTKIQKVVYKLR